MTDVLETESSNAKPRRNRRRGCLLLLASVFFIAVSAWTFRANLFTGAAAIWIVNDAVTKADAIYVLGGGLETRPFEAARLYREGIAPRILISSTRIRRSQKLGIQPTDTDLVRSVLLKEGVPDNVITAIGEDNATTRDEAIALAAWCRENHPKSVIIPTDIFHTHRVSWLFKKALLSPNVSVEVTACELPEYTARDWWQHEEGIIAFQNEILKYLYYRVQY